MYTHTIFRHTYTHWYESSRLKQARNWKKRYLELGFMWFSDRQEKWLFMLQCYKQAINYRSLTPTDRELPQKRKDHSWWRIFSPFTESKHPQTRSQKSGTQRCPELTEHSQHAHTLYSKKHFDIICTMAGFRGKINKSPDGPSIIFSLEATIAHSKKDSARGIRLWVSIKEVSNEQD